MVGWALRILCLGIKYLSLNSCGLLLMIKKGYGLDGSMCTGHLLDALEDNGMRSVIINWGTWERVEVR